MKTIKVVAAVICDSFENKTKILPLPEDMVNSRDNGSFPGGKVEAGETPQQALIREIKEELDVKIKVGELIDTIEYDYPDFHLSMDCFWCTVVDGEIILKEAEASKWLNKDELYTVDWLPADISLIEKLQNSLLM